MYLKTFVLGLALIAYSISLQAEPSYSTSEISTLKDSKASDSGVRESLSQIAKSYDSTVHSLTSMQKTAHGALVGKDVDAAMDLAYTLRGLNNTSLPRRQLALELLEPYTGQPKVQALKDFLQGRSTVKAQAFLNEADTPSSKAVAYMCLAEAFYAKGDTPKALMASVLSLAYNFTDQREEQAKFYLTGVWDSDINLKGSKQEVIARLVERMEGMYHPKTFRHFFEFKSVISFLPEFPYSQELVNAKLTEPIQVIIGFDSNYTYHGAVTMLSAMLSADPSTQYVFHVPEDPESKFMITDDQKVKLQELADLFPGGRFQVVFDLYDPAILPQELAERTFKQWPRSVMFKTYLSEIYSQYDKILWLDSDLIVRADLNPFYSIDSEGAWVVAVRDIHALDHSARLGLEEGDSYFNAGVMVYYNNRIHPNIHLVQEVMDSNHDLKNTLTFPEQDLLSIAFKGHIHEEGYQRNQMRHYYPHGPWNWFYSKHPDARWYNIDKHYSKVIHMAGAPLKPWRLRKQPFYWAFLPWRADGVQDLYWALRDMGPWPFQK